MKKVKGKYLTTSHRLKGFDYGSNAGYFVTLNTLNRIHYFGRIEPDSDSIDPPQIIYSPIGSIADIYWREIPDHFPFVKLDEFIIIPDHIHGILIFNKPEKKDWIENNFGPQSQNLGSVLRGFKSSVKRYGNRNEIDFHWQPQYHDHVIQNEGELERIRNYIKMNPVKWLRKNKSGK